MNDALPLFESAANVRQEKAVSTNASNPVIDALDDIHPDALTPREALELLYTLKELRAAKAVER